MTELLELAIAKLKILSPSEQDAIATLILQELEAEMRWDSAFTQSPDALAKLAGQAMAEYHSGQI